MLKINYEENIVDDSPVHVGKLTHTIELEKDLRAEVVVRAFVDVMRAMSYSDSVIAHTLENIAEMVNRKDF